MARLKIHTGDPRRDRIYGEISEMKYKDLQGAVIQRGLPFDEVINGTFPSLSSWLVSHWDNPKEKEKLPEFDIWMDKNLKERGYKKSSPVRQYKRFNSDYQDKPKQLLPHKEKPPKVKKEKKKKNEQFGIFEGTKKDYTYKLSEKVYSEFIPKYKEPRIVIKKFKDQLCAKVRKKFPEANDKSIAIWMARAIRKLHENSTKTKKD